MPTAKLIRKQPKQTSYLGPNGSKHKKNMNTPIRHVPVGRVGQEELSLGCHGRLDVLLAVDVLLRPVHHADISSSAKV